MAENSARRGRVVSEIPRLWDFRHWSQAAGWREGRAPTWMVGVVIFLISIVTAFTGYISQQNLDAQWIAVNAKDAINSTGAGAIFNPLNFGQIYGLHVMILPIAITLLVVLHVIQVRLRGSVAPIGATDPDAASVAVAAGDYGPVAPMMNALLLSPAVAVSTVCCSPAPGPSIRPTTPVRCSSWAMGGHLSGLAQDQKLLVNQWGC
jgi:hypothetical protein